MRYWTNSGTRKAPQPVYRRALILAMLLLLSACSDPYEHELPASGFVAAGQAEEIASTLKGEDKKLFERWAIRTITSERFPGEPVPANVRLALTNQARYEAIKAEEKAKVEAKLLADQRAYEVEVREREELLKRLKATDSVIKDYFVVSGVSYDIVPIFNSYGSLAYREWQFDLKLNNRTPKEIIGVRGSVLVKDAFGKQLGIYSVRMEPTVPAGKAVNFTVAMRHDPSDPGHVAMLNTQTIFPEWLFDSLAFSDGSAIDESTIANMAGADEIQQQSQTAL
ncbi:hypothetical protein [Pseudoxanthomonas japonensis]|uniref:hypothetical protein n=1 Tax=Pseudoxanthomonas japonensis TaxID=69284 RepID=UPI001BCBF96A|nr:hypothetical protein [Pseudoxanthomonas japonensis]